MEGTGHESPQPHKPMWKISECLELCDESEWELLSPPLSPLESHGCKCFFPRCRPVLGSALRGETLPKLGQAAQKQMRSDTGAKEYSPEPLQAHITKCSTLRLLRSVGALHVEITGTKWRRLVKTSWMGVCILNFCVFADEVMNRGGSVNEI